MKKIYQEFPISFWEDLACFVQDNEIENIGDFLEENKVNSNPGESKPTCMEEIGTLSLINAISKAESNLYGFSPETILFEHIYALKKLGIKNITFNPIGFDEILGIGKSDQSFTKVYTDGKFRIKKVDTKKYGLQDIQDANYTLNVCFDTRKMIQVTHPSWSFYENPDYNKIVSSEIHIKNFKFLSSLPSQKELSLIRLPELTMVTPTLYDWEGRPYFKEEYEQIRKVNELRDLTMECKNDHYFYPKELIKSITAK